MYRLLAGAIMIRSGTPGEVHLVVLIHSSRGTSRSWCSRCPKIFQRPCHPKPARWWARSQSKTRALSVGPSRQSQTPLGPRIRHSRRSVRTFRDCIRLTKWPRGTRQPCRPLRKGPAALLCQQFGRRSFCCACGRRAGREACEASCYVAKGSVESTHKVPTSHYHTVKGPVPSGDEMKTLPVKLNNR